MSAPRNVTPQEAQRWLERADPNRTGLFSLSLAYTVATEPERARAAVVNALLSVCDDLEAHVSGHIRLSPQLRSGLDIIARIRETAAGWPIVFEPSTDGSDMPS